MAVYIRMTSHKLPWTALPTQTTSILMQKIHIFNFFVKPKAQVLLTNWGHLHLRNTLFCNRESYSHFLALVETTKNDRQNCTVGLPGPSPRPAGQHG